MKIDYVDTLGIFVLILETYTKLRRKYRDDYPRLSVEETEYVYCRSLTEAEAALPDMLKRNRDYDIYCLRIVEIPFGIPISDLGRNYSERVYDVNGKKIEERLFRTYPFAKCDEESSEYYGRPPEKLRFRKGDILESRNGIGVVCGLPLPPREIPWGDDSDDSYTVWCLNEYADNPVEEITDGPDNRYTYPNLCHDHVWTTEAFSPRFPFSPKIQRRIDNIHNYMKSKGEL